MNELVTEISVCDIIVYYWWTPINHGHWWLSK